jgi:hypothetical protein
VSDARSERLSPTTVVLVASFGAFLAFLDATIVNVAFPSIRASFPESSISCLSWGLNAYTSSSRRSWSSAAACPT